MPFYEFYSPDTNKIYTFLARSLAWRDRTPRCPDGEHCRMERRVSSFAIIGKAKERDGDDPFADLDETKLEAVMGELERDMEGMDGEHPDPKQLGHFMRKLTGLMGDKTPEALRELVSRLEAGEDPESLEERLEDQFGPMAEPGEEPPEGSAADALWDTVKKKIHLLRHQPRRDPKLYEMSDWV